MIRFGLVNPTLTSIYTYLSHFIKSIKEENISVTLNECSQSIMLHLNADDEHFLKKLIDSTLNALFKQSYLKQPTYALIQWNESTYERLCFLAKK